MIIWFSQWMECPWSITQNNVHISMKWEKGKGGKGKEVLVGYTKQMYIVNKIQFISTWFHNTMYIQVRKSFTSIPRYIFGWVDFMIFFFEMKCENNLSFYFMIPLTINRFKESSFEYTTLLIVEGKMLFMRFIVIIKRNKSY